jgi:hypothetical protein
MKNKFILLFALLSCVFAQAQDTSQPKSNEDSLDFAYKYYVRGGGFFPLVSSTIQINPTNSGIGAIINMEDFLHLSSSPSLFSAEGTTRITKRSMFIVNFFKMNRHGHIETTDRELQIGDTTLEIGAQMNTDLSLNYMGLTYNYLFFAKPNWHAGVDAGVRFLNFSAEFDYTTNGGREGAYATSFTVPVLLFGVNIQGYLLPKLKGNYAFDMFRLSVNGVAASIYESRLGVEYYFLKNFGVGFGYSSILYDISELPLLDNFNGNINYSISGVSTYMTIRF